VAIADAVEVLEVELLDPAGRVPARARDGDAGYDLRTLEGFELASGARRTVSTGIALALPPGVAGLVLPRSGLASRHGITTLNSPGLIDPNYRGEVKVVLHNAGAEPYAARAGDRIAQLLLVPFWAPALRPVDALPPGPDGRGAAGFGSSGR
jgi:dUTP pyrophosphatase